LGFSFFDAVFQPLYSALAVSDAFIKRSPWQPQRYGQGWSASWVIPGKTMQFKIVAICGIRLNLLKGSLTAALLAIGTAAAAIESRNECAQFSGDAAIAACDRAIGDHPNDPFSYFYRGVEYKNRGDLNRSIADYDRAIALNPKIAFFYSNRGNAFRDKGDSKRALADYDQAIALNPALENAYLDRGDYFRNRGEYERAIGDFNQAIRLNPHNAASLNGRCRTFTLAGRELRQALDDCDAARRIAPDVPDIHNSRGLVHLKLGAFDKALEDYEFAMAFDPLDADSLYGHGLAQRGLGHEAVASAELALARSIKSDIADIYAQYLLR
jgi:tetratricopeptide (TPR) repeat protein